jgi:tetratricopeptide (TPR) repeat protein
MGELETARNHLDTGVGIQRAAGIPILRSNYWLYMAMVCLDSGDLSSALTHAGEAVNLARASNEKGFLAISEIMLGRLHAQLDPSQTDGAEELILGQINVLDELRLRPYASQGYLFLGELYADTGRKDEALETLKHAEAEFKDMGMDYWLSKTQEVLAPLETP